MNYFSSMLGQRWFAAFAAFLMVLNVPAQVEAQTKAQVQEAWARPTVQGQTVGGGYFRIDGGATNDRLLGVSADIAQSVELHTMRMDGDVMRMRQLNSVEVPARQTVEFKPGGMHVMLIGLKTPLKVGNSFPMTLRFEKAGAVSVNVRVLPAPPSAEHQH